jgi:putative inorganic carbon (HCO3(-)) transporter
MRFKDLEIWLVGGTVAASFLSIYLLPLAIIIELFFMLNRIIRERRISRLTPVDGLVISFLFLLFLISLIKNPSYQSIIQLLRILSGIAFFYAIVNWCKSLPRIRIIYLGILLLGCLLALISIFSVTWPVGKLTIIPMNWFANFKQIVSDAINPNVLAGSMILILPFSVAILIFNRKNLSLLEQIITTLFTILFLSVIFLSEARGAWIALFFSLLVLLSMKWKWGWLLVIVSLLSLPISWIWFRGSYFSYYVIGGFIGSLNNRVDIWARALFLIKNFSLSGIGFGRFEDTVRIFYPFLEPSGNPIPHAHNLFLQIALDTGILGLIIWLASFLLASISSIYIYRMGKQYHDNFHIALGSAFLCSQIALAIHGLTDSVTWGMVRSAPIVWGIWGAVFACYLTILASRSHNEGLPILLANHPNRIPT